MNYKTFFTILCIFIVCITLCISFAKPQMHKSVLVYNSEYKLVPQEVVTMEEKTMPTVAQVPKQEKTVEKVENKVVQVQKTTPVVQSVKQKVKKTAKKEQVKAITTPQQTQKTAKTENKISTASVVKTETQKTEIPKQETIKVETPQVKVLTQQQEEIEWNRWRSRLQNQIMADAKLPLVPQGTVFKFSFNVDKYGRVSEVQTWSTTPSYTPYAIQYIAPVIRSYQGRSILNFPAGSSRVTTTVQGGWRISVNEKLSTPQDYNDVEKVIK